jgi:hypothetical protein
MSGLYFKHMISVLNNMTLKRGGAEFVNINSNCKKYYQTSINDLNTKMTTTEVNGFLSPGLGSADNSADIFY